MCDFLTSKTFPLVLVLIKTKNRHLFYQWSKNEKFNSIENCLQSLKTLNSNVKWAFSDQCNVSKRWHFFPQQIVKFWFIFCQLYLFLIKGCLAFCQSWSGCQWQLLSSLAREVRIVSKILGTFRKGKAEHKPHQDRTHTRRHAANEFSRNLILNPSNNTKCFKSHRNTHRRILMRRFQAVFSGLQN